MFRAFDHAAREIVAALRATLGPDAGVAVARMTLDQVRAAVPECAAAQDALDPSGGRYARCMLNYIRALLSPPGAPLVRWPVSSADAVTPRAHASTRRDREVGDDPFLF